MPRDQSDITSSKMHANHFGGLRPDATSLLDCISLELPRAPRASGVSIQRKHAHRVSYGAAIFLTSLCACGKSTSAPDASGLDVSAACVKSQEPCYLTGQRGECGGICCSESSNAGCGGLCNVDPTRDCEQHFAKCERQCNGRCGWTQTTLSKACSAADSLCTNILRSATLEMTRISMCQSDGDCVAVEGTCPFGCHLLYNRQLALRSLTKLMTDYQTSCESCEQTCDGPPASKCIAGECRFAR